MLLSNYIYRTRVLTPEGADRWYVPTHETKFFDFELVLPSGVTCEQCIMQVRNSNANKFSKYAFIFPNNFYKLQLLFCLVVR